MGNQCSPSSYSYSYTINNQTSSNVRVIDKSGDYTVTPGTSTTRTRDGIVSDCNTATIITANNQFYYAMWPNVTYNVTDKDITLQVGIPTLSFYSVQGSGGTYYINNQSTGAVSISDGPSGFTVQPGEFRKVGAQGKSDYYGLCR